MPHGLACHAARRPARHRGPGTGRQVTSATFGDDDVATLYITTAREGLTEADLRAQPHARDIFACRAAVAGRRPFMFAA